MRLDDSEKGGRSDGKLYRSAILTSLRAKVVRSNSSRIIRLIDIGKDTVV